MVRRASPNASQRQPESGAAVLAILTSAMGAGPLFNFGLAATSSLVLTRFGISSAQFGAVLTMIFASAAIVSIGLGVLADRIPPRAQFVILFGGAAVALALAGLAPGYGFLLGTAVFAGISQAMSNPTTNRAVRALAPREKRTGWIGVKQSGVQGSQLVAGLIFPPLALTLGWSGAAFVVAGLCLALLVAALAIVPDWRNRTSNVSDGGAEPAPRGPASSATAPAPAMAPETGPLAIPIRRLGLLIALLTAISFLSGFGLMATNAYLALFAVQSFGYSVALGGLLVAAGGLIGVISRIWWGQRMARGASAGSLLVIMSLGALGAAALLVTSAALHVAWLVWIAVALHGITVLGANVVINSSLMRLAGARLGAATGVNATGMYAGFATGPIVAGLVIDASGAFTGGWLVVGAAYIACLGAALVLAALVRRMRAGSAG